MYQDEIDKFATLVELLQQLVDQNEYNRKMCASLTSLAVQVKVCCPSLRPAEVHCTSFVKIES